MIKNRKAQRSSSNGRKINARVLQADELRRIVAGETMDEYLARQATQENKWDAEGMVTAGIWGGVFGGFFG